MKRAKAARSARRTAGRSVKPRDPVAVSPLLKKGGAHRRRDKRAARTLLKARLRREPDGE